MDNKEGTILIAFGATGDLMTKKVIPALFELEETHQLPKDFKIIGVSRRDFSDTDFQVHVREVLIKHGVPKIEFLNRFTFVSGDFEDSDVYSHLKEKILELGKESISTNLLFYFSVQQKYYEPIINNIKEIKPELYKVSSEDQIRLLIEKPIGKNTEEFYKLERILSCCFTEEQIYRIDHYLHKKVVRNLIALRFFNPIFEAAWNNNFVESIEIFTHEDFGVEKRGAFYDELGTLRDVGQNHLLELVALITMEKPESFDANSFQKARANAIKNLKVMTYRDLKHCTYRSQYSGYTGIEGVDSNSQIETYFKIKTYSNDTKWENVPIILSSGKQMGETKKEIIIRFKSDIPSTDSFFGLKGSDHKMIFRLPPTEEIRIDFDLFSDLNADNLGLTIKEVNHQTQYVEEYMKAITDANAGNRAWFVGAEEVEAEWQFIDPIVNAWHENKVELDTYTKNSDMAVERSMFIHQEVRRDLEKEIGVVGLGKMGGNIARHLVEKGWRVIGYNRSADKVDEIQKDGVTGAYSLQELVSHLQRPRKIWVMLPAGDPTHENIIGENGLIKYLEDGDIIIDAGNSHYKGSKFIHDKLSEKGIKFIDAGVSGGPKGAREGACIMIGGELETFKFTEPLFADVSLPGGYKFFPGVGAGHFVKMVHNGIEYGMMQSIGEGFEVLKKSEYGLQLLDVVKIYNRGSVIESRLIDWLYDAYQEYTTELKGISGSVHQSGEALWTIQAAKELGVEAKVIEDSLNFRLESQANPSYTGKVISALRNQFGGHSVQKKK